MLDNLIWCKINKSKLGQNEIIEVKMTKPFIVISERLVYDISQMDW